MREFLRNLAILSVLALAILFLFPDTVSQILGVYNGLGLLPIIIVIAILTAIPRRSKRRNR